MIFRLAVSGLIAVGLVGLGLIFWVATRHPAREVAHARGIAVLAAGHPVRPGALLKPEDLASVTLTNAQMPASATVDSPANRRGMVGAMVRRALGAGDVILPRDVMRPGDHGFLAAVLDPGMRAASVGVDRISGTAGLIWPGDRVDVILTESDAGPGVPAGRGIAAETVLSDIRVIAIDQQLVEGAVPGDKANGGETRTVTLEVAPIEAERLEVASRLGRLSLVVRATAPLPAPASGSRLARRPSAATPTVWASDVAPSLGMQPSAAAPATVRVFQGAAEPKEFHF